MIELEASWSKTPAEVLAALGSTPNGLTSAEARKRLAEGGPNSLSAAATRGWPSIFLGQFKNPLAWMLLFAVVVSSIAREWTDAVVIVAILLASATLSTAQEHRASRAVEALRSRIALKATVFRDGREGPVDAVEVVRGDVVSLSAGALVPADAVLLSASDLQMSQAILTGETFPVEKSVAPSAEGAGLSGRTNVVFQGTSVRSGTARAVIMATGRATEYGRIADALNLRAPETDFERGIRRFGYLLTRIMLVLVVFTFASTVLAHKSPIDSLLFAIALAVGLAPEMLPAVIAINLSHGARAMADKGVIVRRLAAIENFGAMDVLCTDKTGTLTEGTVGLDRALDAKGVDSTEVLVRAALNAHFDAGLRSPLDDAILERARAAGVDLSGREKVDEVPYDFIRKRVSVAVRGPDGRVEMVTKGAFAGVMAICASVRDGASVVPRDDGRRRAIEARVQAFGREGSRVLAVASREASQAVFHRDDEREMVLEGVLTFLDPPKEGAREALAALAALGVQVKVISGDSRDVGLHLAERVGLTVEGVLTGQEMLRTSDEAMLKLCAHTTLFAEVDPNQKERIIHALRKTGHVVGYMGDGINDAPALHAADVAISVEGAVDVAREAADFVLLRHDLGVLRDGIVTGRTTFANTIKYIFTTESANFGNMLSMAAAAAFLPFLPLLASQVLLNNFLSDVPAMAIGTDRVDPDQLARPRRWDLRALRDFMLSFGALSSVFDLLTFALLYWGFHSPATLFRSGWFLESLLTEVTVAMVVRTRLRFYQSRPSNLLLGTSIGVAVLSTAFLYTPLARPFGLGPLPLPMLAALVGMTVAYVLSVEAMKQAFFRRFGERDRPTLKRIAGAQAG